MSQGNQLRWFSNEYPRCPGDVHSWERSVRHFDEDKDINDINNYDKVDVSFKCVGTSDPEDLQCIPIDYCASNPCGEHEVCSNGVGTHVCSCDAGFEPCPCCRALQIECDDPDCELGFAANRIKAHGVILRMQSEERNGGKYWESDDGKLGLWGEFKIFLITFF